MKRFSRISVFTLFSLALLCLSMSCDLQGSQGTNGAPAGLTLQGKLVDSDGNTYSVSQVDKIEVKYNGDASIEPLKEVEVSVNTDSSFTITLEAIDEEKVIAFAEVMLLINDKTITCKDDNGTEYIFAYYVKDVAGNGIKWGWNIAKGTSIVGSEIVDSLPANVKWVVGN